MKKLGKNIITIRFKKSTSKKTLKKYPVLGEIITKDYTLMYNKNCDCANLYSPIGERYFIEYCPKEELLSICKNNKLVDYIVYKTIQPHNDLRFAWNVLEGQTIRTYSKYYCFTKETEAFKNDITGEQIICSVDYLNKTINNLSMFSLFFCEVFSKQRYKWERICIPKFITCNEGKKFIEIYKDTVSSCLDNI